MIKNALMLFVAICVLCSFMTGCNSQNDNQDSSVAENVSEGTAESFEPRSIKFTSRTFEWAYFRQGRDEFFNSLIIKSVDEFNEFKSEYECNGLEFDPYINSINDSFFDENALFLHYETHGDCSYQCQIKDLFVDGTKLTATITSSYCTDSADLACRADTFVAEISKIDIMSVEEIDFITENQYWATNNGSLPKINSSKAIEHEISIFGGTLDNFYKTHDRKHITYGIMSVIDSQKDMKNFLNSYTYSDKGENLNDSADQYNEEFFKNNIIVAVPVKTNIKNVAFKIAYAKNNSWTIRDDLMEGVLFGINAYFDEESVSENSESIIFIRFDKAQVPENPIPFAIFGEVN